MRTRRASCLVLAVALTAAAAPGARAAQDDADQAALVAKAQEVVVRALNFTQGDLASLTDARDDFTPEAWQEFMKHLSGWLDGSGAPTFSSSFVPSGKTAVGKRENGVVHLTFRGALKHTQNRSSTTYRAAVALDVGGTPLKILHLEEIACVGAAPDCQGG